MWKTLLVPTKQLTEYLTVVDWFSRTEFLNSVCILLHLDWRRLVVTFWVHLASTCSYVMWHFFFVMIKLECVLLGSVIVPGSLPNQTTTSIHNHLGSINNHQLRKHRIWYLQNVGQIKSSIYLNIRQLHHLCKYIIINIYQLM